MREPFKRSPMLQMIERKERNYALRRIGKISAAVVAGVLAVAIGSKAAEWFPGSSSVSSGQSGPCMPDDYFFECLDRLHDDEAMEFPFSHGDPDGCILDSIEEQLQSPLCCPHVAADPMTCPSLDEAVDAGAEDSKPVDSDSLPGGVETPEEAPKEKSTPLPSIPRRIPLDVFDEGDVAPG